MKISILAVWFLLFFSFAAFGQVDNTNEEPNYLLLNYSPLNSAYVDHKVDSIMTLGINKHAFPGAQLLVAKSGKIIFHKSYGYHTYDNLNPVDNNDLYDLASVTKIAGTLPAVMKLVDQGKIELDE